MDKKYIEALSNFAFALEELVEQMREKAEAEEKAAKTGAGALGTYNKVVEISKTLENIKQGVDEIKDSNKEILDNQKTLLDIAKDKEKSGGLIGGLTDKDGKKKVKTGVKTIALIAGAIIAIGLAFKIVGGVDFASVIALSISLPLIAMAFVKVAVAIDEHGLGFKEIGLTALTLILMAGTLVAASWILSMTSTVSIPQFLTALGIAVMFSLMLGGVTIMGLTFGGMGEALEELGRFKLKNVIVLPLVLVGISLAIVASSYILGELQPVDPMLLLNMVLQGIALGIVMSAMIIPITIMSKVKLKPKDVLTAGFMIVTIAAAVSIASHFVSAGDYSVAPPLGWSFKTAIGISLFSIPVIALGMAASSGIGMAGLSLGVLSVILVATAIMLSSHIISAGDYSNYPGLGWVIGTTAALGLFAIEMLALGGIAMTGIGFAMLALGYPVMLMVARTIVDVSKVLSKGEYDNAGNLAKWATATTLLYLTFVPMMVALGAMGIVSSIMSFFGGGADPFEVAKKVMLQIAWTMVSVSRVLSQGDYSGGPTEDWAKGISLSLEAFAPIFRSFERMNVWSIFGNRKIEPGDYAKIIRTISFAIVTAGEIFRRAPSRWEGGPTEKWAKGVGGAISAFAPVVKLALDNDIWDAITGGDTTEKMGQIIRKVAHAIKDAARIFNEGESQVYRGGPTKKWVEGVGKSIEIFGDTMVKADEWNWDDDEAAEYIGIIRRIARSIVSVAGILSGGGTDFMGNKVPKPNWHSYPKKNWVEGVSASLTGFADIMVTADDWNWDDDEAAEYIRIIRRIARNVVRVARIMEPMGNMSVPDPEHGESLADNIKSWNKIMKAADSLETGGMFFVSLRIMTFASSIDYLADSLNNLNDAISQFQGSQLEALSEVNGVLISLSVMDSDNFREITAILDDQSSELSELFNRIHDKMSPKKKQAEGEGEGGWWDSISGKAAEGVKEKVSPKTLDDVIDKLDELKEKLDTISQNSTTLTEQLKLMGGGEKDEIGSISKMLGFT